MGIPFNPLDWVKFIFERFDKRKQSKIQARKELIDKIDSLTDKIDSVGAVLTGLTENYTKLSGKMETLDLESCISREEILEELGLIKKGLQKELFDTLFVQQRRFVKQGYCSPNDKGAFEEIYDVYHSFGKNGRADIYRTTVLALPDEPPIKEEKK